MKCSRNILFGNGKELKYKKNEIDYDLNLEVSKSAFSPIRIHYNIFYCLYLQENSCTQATKVKEEPSVWPGYVFIICGCVLGLLFLFETKAQCEAQAGLELQNSTFLLPQPPER